MRPICVAFSKAKVLIIGQDECVKTKLKSVLTGFGVSNRHIIDCLSWRSKPKKSLKSYDLIVLDCNLDRFSRDLILEELAGNENDTSPPAPIVLIAEHDVETAIEQAFGEKEHAIIRHSFCTKSLYLKLHLLIAKFRSSLVDEGLIAIEDLANRDVIAPVI